MSDRSAVITTLNGKVIDWKVFENSQQAYEHYNADVGKLREMIQHTSDDSDIEIMLCDIRQYALSKPKTETRLIEEEPDWYSRYLTAMANQARRIKGFRPRWDLHMWKRLKNSAVHILSDEDDPSKNGL